MLRVLAIPFLLAAVAAAQDPVRSAIVKVYTTSQEANYGRPWEMHTQENSTGSGCVIAGKRILTNAHVVSDQTFVRVQRSDLADKHVATVAAVSHELDLALLTVSDEAFFDGVEPLAVGDLPSAGDSVVTLGFPTGGTRIAVTEGVISRIDRARYSHSAFDNLVCQIDAAINPGSSGGPVLAGGVIVGVAFQVRGGQNIGYMVPAPVVRHFLDDIGDGSHDGTPAVPFWWQVLENAQLRRHYRMTDDHSGVLITKISPLFEGDGKLRTRDVLLGIDDYDVANDGTIEFRPGERIEMLYAIDRKHIGESATFHLLRDGRPLDVTLALSAAKRSYGWIVPRTQYETRPSYYIVGGLVFCPLTQNYYDTWDKWDDVPVNLQRYWYEMRTADNADREEVVVLTDILPDEINVGYTGFEDSVVREVNGKRVGSLRDLVAILEGNDHEVHRIVFEDSDAEIVLSKENLGARSKGILERYRVPADRSADLTGTAAK
ncbi:MAG: serine protease [Planctomycetes bacterium]|nr:serine protease [Planctomycetota bacterium]